MTVSPRKPQVALWVFLCAMIPVYPLVATYFNYAPFIGGALEFADSLRRIDAGILAGRDFTPYHGLGTIWALVPLFKLFGGTLFAVTVSAQLVAYGAFVVAALLLGWLAGLRGWHNLFVATILIVLAKLAATVGGPHALELLVNPGLSGLPIRGLAPFAVAFLILLAEILLAERKSTISRPLSWGAVGGAFVIWANDSGPASLLALFVVYQLFYADYSAPRRAIARSALFIVVAVGGFAVALLLATAGSPARWLLDSQAMAADQFWFFAGFREADRVFDGAGLLGLLSGIGKGGLAWWRGLFLIALGYVLWAGRRAPRDRLKIALLGFLGLAALLSGMAASLGGHLDERYFAAAFRASLFIVPAAVFSLSPGVRQSVSRLAFAWQKHIPLASMALLLLANLGAATFAARRISAINPNSGESPFVAAFGARLPARVAAPYEAMRDVVRGMKSPADGDLSHRLFSFSQSAFNAATGSLSPSPYGTFMHALGDRGRQIHRHRVLAAKPHFVVTLNPAYSILSRWEQRMGWYLFRDIVGGYLPVAATAGHVIWERRQKRLPGPVPEFACRWREISPAESKIIVTDIKEVATGPLLYLDIALRYSLTVAPGWVPVIGQRALLTVTEQRSAVPDSGYSVATPAYPRLVYGIPPDKTGWSIALEHRSGSPSMLRLKAMPLGRARLVISACTASFVAPSPFTDGRRWPAVDSLVPGPGGGEGGR